MPRFTVATALAAYDGRSHILGASVLAAVDQAIRDRLGETAATFQVTRAKFTRKTGNNGTIFLDLDEDNPDRPADSAAEAQGIFAGRKITAFFVPDPNVPPTCNLPSGNDLSDIAATEEFHGQCHIRARTLEPVLRTLVDANKLVHLASPAMLKGKVIAELLLVENLSIDPALAEVDSQLSLRNVSTRSGFGRLITLAELCFRDREGSIRRPRISMSFHVIHPATEEPRR